MPTPYMSLTIPTPGDAGAGVWDDALDADLSIIDAHTHASGSGVTIKSNAIEVDANITFAGFIPTNVGAIGFAERIAGASPTIPNQSLWVNSVNDDLYFRSAAGTDNRLTVGGVLNVSITGGIVGDYAAAGAVFSYDDTNKRYKAMRSQSPDFWASVAMGDLELLEKASGISNKITVKSPAALAASYVVTFPAALPGSTQIVQMSSAGALTASNTIANAVTMSGLLTASAGVTAAANQHVTVSGAGEFKHGDLVLALPGMLAAPSSAANANANSGGYIVTTGAVTLIMPIPLKTGDRLTACTHARFGDGAVDVSAGNVTVIDADGTLTQLATDLAETNISAAWSDKTLASFTAHTLVAGQSAFFWVNIAATGYKLGTVRVTYNRP